MARAATNPTGPCPSAQIALAGGGASDDHAPPLDDGETPEMPDTAPQSPDAELARQALNGQPEAFATIVECYERPIFGLLRRMTATREDAEDLAQEVFVKAWRNLRQWDRRRTLLPWLYQIARNTAISAGRRKRVQVIEIDRVEASAGRGALAEPETVRQRLEQDDRLERLRAAARQLGGDDAVLFQLRYRDEMSVKDVAEALGELPTTTAVRLHRLRARLCGMLNEENES